MVLASFGSCGSQRAVHASVCSRVVSLHVHTNSSLSPGPPRGRKRSPWCRACLRGGAAWASLHVMDTVSPSGKGFAECWLLINQCSLINHSAQGLCLSHPQTSGGELEGKRSARPREPDVCHHTEGMSRCRTSPAFLPARPSRRL